MKTTADSALLDRRTVVAALAVQQFRFVDHGSLPPGLGGTDQRSVGTGAPPTAYRMLRACQICLGGAAAPSHYPRLRKWLPEVPTAHPESAAGAGLTRLSAPPAKVSQTRTLRRTLPGKAVTTAVSPGPFAVSRGHPVRYRCWGVGNRCRCRRPPRIEHPPSVSLPSVTGATTVRFRSNGLSHWVHPLPPPLSGHAMAGQQLASPLSRPCAQGTASCVGGIAGMRSWCIERALMGQHRLLRVRRPYACTQRSCAEIGRRRAAHACARDAPAAPRNGLAQKLIFASPSADNSRRTQFNQIGGVSWKRERSCR